MVGTPAKMVTFSFSMRERASSPSKRGISTMVPCR